MISLDKQSCTSVTQRDIEDGLQKLGISRGDAVEVHSSLSSFGYVQGGASTVIDALMNVVGEDGALVMSAYPVSRALPLIEEEKARGVTWRVRFLKDDSEERTGMGVIADEFRRRSGTVLGKNPGRVCAWGRDAELHSKGYKHLLNIDGWALLLGVDINRCSSIHLAGVDIPDKILEIFKIPEDIKRDYPADVWAIGYGETPGDPWMKAWEEAKRKGLIRERRIGNAECKLFKAKAFIGIYEDFLRTDPFGLFGLEKTK